MGMDAPVSMTPPTTPASIPVSLRRQFPDASFVGCAEIVVADATDRSGECTPGCLFAALPGTNVHGRAFVAEAIQRGATAVLTDVPLAGVRTPQCVVRDVRAAYSRLCHTLYQWPSRRLGLVGVTGTNGKTTVTWLVRTLLRHVGRPTALAGTIEYDDGRHCTPASLTTPDSRTLARWLASAKEHRCTHATLELSSHALAQDRAAGLELDVAIVTNITHDHLDYHGAGDAYRAAKARIASLLKRGGRLVLNADDAGSSSLLAETPSTAQCLTYGLQADADVRAVDIEPSPAGSRFRIVAGLESAQVETPLIGLHNVSNILAAVSAGLHFGSSLPQAVEGVSQLAGVPGRLQPVNCGQPFQVYVDFAHTPDALRCVLAAVRAVTRGRVICLFGAGGDRDRSKRPGLGAAAAAADLIVLTSDNPRTEDPQSIIYDVLSGCVSPRVHVDPDRAAAIHWALEQAQPGDSVLIAGKGHETCQIIGRERLPFDDISVCRQQLLRHAFQPHILSADRTSIPA